MIFTRSTAMMFLFTFAVCAVSPPTDACQVADEPIAGICVELRCAEDVEYGRVVKLLSAMQGAGAIATRIVTSDTAKEIEVELQLPKSVELTKLQAVLTALTENGIKRIQVSNSHNVRDEDSQDQPKEKVKEYVECRARLVELDRSYRWSDNGSFGHDDGVSPLASFVLSEPEAHADFALSILFKYAVKKAALPAEAAVGDQFSFLVPASVLKAEVTVIVDNIDVRNLRKID